MGWTPTDRRRAADDDELVVVELDPHAGTRRSVDEISLGRPDTPGGNRRRWWGVPVVLALVGLSVWLARLGDPATPRAEPSTPSTASPTSTTAAPTTTARPATTAPITTATAPADGTGTTTTPVPLIGRPVNWRIYARAFTTSPQVLAVNPTTADVHDISFPGSFPRQVLVAPNRFVMVSDTTLYEQSRRFEPVHDFVQDAAMNASGVLWFQSQRTLFVSPDRGGEPAPVEVGETGRLVEGSAIAGVTPDGSAVVRLPDGGVLLVAADGSTSTVDTGGGQVLAADGGGVAVVTCAVSTCDTEFRSWTGLVVRLGVRAELAQFSPSGARVLTAFTRSGLQFLDLAANEVVGEINRFSVGGAWAPDGSAYVSISPATSALVVVDLDRVAGIASQPFDGPVEVAAVG